MYTYLFIDQEMDFHVNQKDGYVFYFKCFCSVSQWALWQIFFKLYFVICSSTLFNIRVIGYRFIVNLFTLYGHWVVTSSMLLYLDWDAHRTCFVDVLSILSSRTCLVSLMSI